MQDVEKQEMPVRINGRLIIAVCSRGWMYFPEGVRVGDSVETMEEDVVVVQDDRLGRVIDIMLASSGWVPQRTEATPFGGTSKLFGHGEEQERGSCVGGFGAHYSDRPKTHGNHGRFQTEK